MDVEYGKMMADLALLNAKIYTNGRIIEGGLTIKEGKIVAVSKMSNVPNAIETIDVEKKVVLPGLIDSHTHLRDLQLSYKEDFYTGTCAALAGGFTTVLDMPNTRPMTNTYTRLKNKIEEAKKKIVANVGFYVGFSDEIEETYDVASLGVVGFKIYLNKPAEELGIRDEADIAVALRRAKDVQQTVAIHAEDRSIIEKMKRRLQAQGGDTAEAYLQAHPPRAEAEAVRKTIKIAREIQTPIHFCHISTTDALSHIVQAKAEGWPITCEATPHHLLLSQKVFRRSGNTAITDPPLRSQDHVKTLWCSLINRKIDLVASDHAPHILKEKQETNVWKVPPGIPGLETTLPLFLTMVKKGKMGLRRLVEVLAEKPAQIFRLKGKGFIKPGFDADLTIIDLHEESIIDSSKFHSKSKYSPFKGWRVFGRAVKTFVGGVLSMEDGEVLAKPGKGHIVQVHPP